MNTKYLITSWNHRPDGRKFKFRHNKRVSSVYLQILSLEVVAWYR